MTSTPITSADVASLAERLADQRASVARADRQAVIDDLERQLAELRAEYDAHLATHTPSPFGQLRSNLDQVRARFALPADAQLVSWADVAQPGDTLNTVCDRLTAAQVLVLPERDDPYLIDLSQGFYGSGVKEVMLADGTRQKVASLGGSRPRWFSAVRLRRGMLGLGPESRIGYRVGDWRAPAQPRPSAAGGAGRWWWKSDGTRGHELVGSQEKLIEIEHRDAYLGNFALEPAPDLGGIAYNALSVDGSATIERVTGDGSWRGFAGVPNGETGMVSIRGGRYRILGLEADGAGVGSSPLMVNASPGGTLEHARFAGASAGMPTIWGSSGEHTWTDVESVDDPSHGVNLEKCADGFKLRWEGGRNAPAREGKGMHIGLHALGRATVELVDIALGELGRRSNVDMPAGAVVQLYGDSTDPKKVTVSVTQDGRPVTATAFGKGGRVQLAS